MPNMMVDNFDKIEKMLSFHPGQFYFLQVIRRKKDQIDKENYKSVTVLKTFYIETLEDYLKFKPIIKDICAANNARAYIHLGRRDYEECALMMNYELSVLLRNKQYDHLQSLYETVVGKARGRGPCWVIDIDSKDWTIVDFIAEAIDKCDRKAELPSAIVTSIPTLNGYHLITHPFNRKQFEPYQIMHNIDVHTNNPTLLFLDFDSTDN